MGKTKAAKPLRWPPLATGQVWRVGDMHLEVGQLGPFMANYKLAKPGAVRVRNTIDGKASVEKYLKKHKAVLLP